MKGLGLRFFTLALLLLLAGNAHARNQELVIFGDSLTDMGNLYSLTKVLGFEPGIPPSEAPYEVYWEGRFSNGPIWAEYLAAGMGLELTASVDARFWRPPEAINFAWGGATSEVFSQTPAGLPVPGVLGQVSAYKWRFLWGRPAPASALYAIWGGADDFLLNLENPPPVEHVVANIVKAITQLHEAGARRFLVANLPELCILELPPPQVLTRCDNDPATLTLAEDFNRQLLAALEEFADANEGAKIYPVDIFTAANELFQQLGAVDPSLLGPGPAVGCIFSLPGNPAACATIAGEISDLEETLGSLIGPDALSLDAAGNPAPRIPVLWDEQHPTTTVQFIIAGVMQAALAAEPL